VNFEPIAFNRIQDRMRDAGVQFRYQNGKIRAQGICHDARAAGAVNIERGRNGDLVVHCHACGGNKGFLAAIGSGPDDLYDEPLPERGPRGNNAADEWMPCVRDGHHRTAEYLYTDEYGTVEYGVCRCNEKCFWQWRPDSTAKSGRRWKLTDDQGNWLVQRYPYRLPAIKAAVAAEAVIWVCEGEKDVHALVERGLEATCNSGGAGKWTADHAKHLLGADVTVVADRDDAGRRHAELVVETLRSVARSVYVVQSRYGKDAFDHFAGGGTGGDFIEVWAPIPFPGDLVST